MKRHRRSYLSGLFFNTGNYDERTVGEGFGYSRQFTDTINQGMLDDERIEREHKRVSEENKKKEAENPDNNPTDTPEEK